MKQLSERQRECIRAQYEIAHQTRLNILESCTLTEILESPYLRAALEEL